MTLDSYIRVSKVNGRAGDRYISPDEQRRLIADGANRAGVEVGIEVVEQDVSGAKAASERGLEELLRRAERGESSGLIVAWQDRLSRGSLLEQAQVWERLEQAGARLIAVGDGIDSVSSGSEMLFAIKAAIAREQWKRYQANWHQAKSNAIKRGVHIGCRAPLGYRRGEDGRLVVDEEAAEFVRAIFAKRTDGLSWDALSRWTHEQGRTVTASGLRKLVSNPVYLGQVQHGQDYVKKEAHPAIVSRRDYDLANAAMTTSTKRGRTGRTAGKTLSQGLVRCSECGLKMHVHVNSRGRLALQCRNALCDVPNNIQVEPLDAEIVERLMAELSNENFFHPEPLDAEIVERHWEGLSYGEIIGPTIRVKGTGRAPLDQAEKELADAEHDRDQFLAQTDAIRLLGQQLWNETLTRYVAKVDEAISNLAAVQAETMTRDKVFMLDEKWVEWSHEERRKFVHAFIRTILVFPVHGKRGVSVSSRVMLQMVGDPERWI